MKQRWLLSLTALVLTTALAAFLPGCTAAAPATPGPAPSQEENPPESVLPEAGAPQSDRLVVADAGMYRGTVTSLMGGLQTDTGLIFTLEAYPGSSEIPSMTFVANGDTQAGFDLGSLDAGDHLEVFYPVPADGSQPDTAAPQPVLAANKLLPAEMVYYNGTLLSVSGDGDSRSLLLQNLNTPEGTAEADLYVYQTVFHLGDETQLYLSDAQLVPGAVLNIYHRGAYAMSLPPQGMALEVRLMAGAG